MADFCPDYSEVVGDFAIAFKEWSRQDALSLVVQDRISKVCAEGFTSILHHIYGKITQHKR